MTAGPADGVPGGGVATDPSGLFAALRDAVSEDWRRYTHHAFVAGLADGTLPPDGFRHYLIQDYRFLIHFARAYALAVYKSDRLEDMRHAAASMSAIIDTEMDLHRAYCRRWGIGEEALGSAPEATATVAYTRFVLDCGMAGDLLDLHVALAPCVIGYAEIAARLAADPATRMDGNPYREWIETYSGAEYRDLAAGAVAHLDALAARRGGNARRDDLIRIFRTATRLEAGFWEMGLLGLD